MTTPAEQLDLLSTARAALRAAEVSEIAAVGALRAARLATRHARERLSEALDECIDGVRQPRIPFETALVAPEPPSIQPPAPPTPAWDELLAHSDDYLHKIAGIPSPVAQALEKQAVVSTRQLLSVARAADEIGATPPFALAAYLLKLKKVTKPDAHAAADAILAHCTAPAEPEIDLCLRAALTAGDGPRRAFNWSERVAEIAATSATDKYLCGLIDEAFGKGGTAAGPRGTPYHWSTEREAGGPAFWYGVTVRSVAPTLTGASLLAAVRRLYGIATAQSPAAKKRGVIPTAPPPSSTALYLRLVPGFPVAAANELQHVGVRTYADLHTRVVTQSETAEGGRLYAALRSVRGIDAQTARAAEDALRAADWSRLYPEPEAPTAQSAPAPKPKRKGKGK